MQRDFLTTNWKHFRNEINDHWAQLSDEDLDQVNGRRDDLVGLLESKYGFTRRRAESEVERVVTEFEDKVRKAA
jgi:uncharacterized protein YjbJ (UPF0337 family)